MRIRLLAPVAMLLLAAGAAGAQIPSITLFGGAVMPTGDAGNALNAGFTAGAALDMHVPVMPLGVRVEGSYSRFGLSNLPSGVSANTSDMGVNLNAVMTLVHLPLMKPYITAGPSYSNLKAPSGTNGETVTEGHWGYNAGGGLDFGLGPIGMRLDVRYKHISVDGGSWTSVPMTVGFRF